MEKEIKSSYEDALVTYIKKIAEESQHLIDEYEKLKNLSYSSKHKSILEQMQRFVEKKLI